MLARLAKEQLNVSELAEPFELTFAGVSKHLKVLEEAGLVEKTKEGRSFRCKAQIDKLNAVAALLEELGVYWSSQLDSLEKFLGTDAEKKSKKGEAKKWKQHKISKRTRN
jgi:DNA-binding transcriptional ArsR family regulator